MTKNDPATPPKQPSPSEVRAALRRILDSPQFAQAERSKAFLCFAVEETLAGRASRLRGRTIGVEVFGRPEGYDASADPLVRVEAGRLRRRLAEYDADAGAQSPVRIELPRGGYFAEFSYTGMPSRRWRLAGLRGQAALYGTALVVLVGAMLGAVALLSPGRSSTSAPAGLEGGPGSAAIGVPTVLLSSVTNLGDDPALADYGRGLGEELILKLSELSVPVITHLPGSASGFDDDSFALAAGAAYVLTATTRGSLDDARISFRLVDARAGTQLWANAYDQRLDAHNLPLVEQHTASAVAAVVANPYGPLYMRELARLRALPADAPLGRAACMLVFYDYRRTLAPARRADAMACFEHALATEQRWPDGHAAWALLAIDAWRFSPRENLTYALLGSAIDEARTALDMDGGNRLANFALSLGLFYQGHPNHLAGRIARSLEMLPPTDYAMQARLAELLALLGEWPNALALTSASFELGIDVPGWYFSLPALDALRNGEYEKALHAALRIDCPAWFGSPVLEAAAAGLTGRPEIAQHSIQQLLELDPEFAATGRAMLLRWLQDEELVATIARGLSKAGLELHYAAPADLSGSTWREAQPVPLSSP